MNISLKQFLKKASLLTVLSSFVQGVLWFLPCVFVGMLFLGFLDHFLEIPPFGRQAIWCGIMGLASFGLVRSFFPLSKFTVQGQSKTLFEALQKRHRSLFREDELVLGQSLSKQQETKGISTELRNRYLMHLEQRLEKCSPAWGVPVWPWKKALVWFVLLFLVSGLGKALWPSQFPLGKRILFPFGFVDLNKFILVQPGNTTVPWGGEIEVKVTSKQTSISRPALYVKTNENWLEVQPHTDRKGTQSYVFQGLVEPLYYRVKYKRDWGEKFSVIPMKPIVLKEFFVEIQNPRYLGGNSQSQNSAELTGLPGSRVRLEAISNTDLEVAKLLFSGGAQKDVKLKSKNKLNVSFDLVNEGAYGFYLMASDGRSTRSKDLYPIHIMTDEAPTVELLSPEEDLVIGPQETLPLTFDAKDDFGLKEAYLNIKNGKGEKRSKKILSYNEGTQSQLDTYAWSLSLDSFRAGQVWQYQIEVRDANTVTGPGRAMSQWRIIEIASFKKGHENVEKELEKWRDDVLELLAELTTLKAKADSNSDNVSSLTQPFNAMSSKSRTLEEVLEKIVNAMEEDPLADYEVWLEHRSMADNFHALNEGAMKRAQAALQTNNAKSASDQMEQSAAELERMLTLSEDLSKTQRARDVREAGEDLAKMGEELLKELEAASNQKANPEQIKQIREMLRKAQSLLQEMAQSLEKFPEELPEDFVNQEALENLQLGETQDLLSQINEALKRGDTKAAMDMAKQFLDMAQKMSDQIGEAHESFLNDDSAEKLAQEMDAKSKELSAIQQKQRDLLTQTQKLESKRMKEVLKEQENILAQLYERQKKVVEKSHILVKNAAFVPVQKRQLQSQIRLMKEVMKEFEIKRVQNSGQWLTQITKGLDEIIKKMGDPEVISPEKQALLEILVEENSILEELKKPVEPNQPFSNEDKEQFSALKQKQDGVLTQTRALKKDLQKLSQKTASLGIPLTQALNDAASSMNQASNELSQKKSQHAQRSEQKALSSLHQAQNAMQQAQQAMGQMSGQRPGGQGGKGGQPRAMRRGNKSGNQGEKVGKVRLPTAEDYRPPKEFREELLESLKEKYPDIYEDIIHKYFKRLSE